MKEEWKDIKGYEGYYKISNYGRVYSYYSKRIKKNLLNINKKDSYKRFLINLSLNSKRKQYTISKLVWDHFGDKFDENLQVDHIDNNSLNNRIDNLQLITRRLNCSKDKDKSKTSSKYTGVTWDKENKKWKSQIRINNKSIFLGRYDNEYDAHISYQIKLKEINE